MTSFLCALTARSFLPPKLKVMAPDADTATNPAMHMSGMCALNLTCLGLHTVSCQGEPERCLMPTGVPSPDQQQPQQQQAGSKPDQAWPASLLPFRVPPKLSPATPCMPLGWHRKAPTVQPAGTAHPGENGAARSLQDQAPHPIVPAYTCCRPLSP